MRIGDASSKPSAPATPSRYQSPAEELYLRVVDEYDVATFVARMGLAAALETRERNFRALPAEVRAMFEHVVEAMGIAD